MTRANRVFASGQVWHITHRCHCRAFLLKFVRDRRRWRHWLYEATRRYGLCVLNYIVTSNHIHLLCADQGNLEIPRAMQLVAARTAQEYNRRKRRRGAFWDDRYHATAVQTDAHLRRCMVYIDLNMVRAGVVRHPREWEVCGYNEIRSPWQRKQVIDFDALGRYLDTGTHAQLTKLLEESLLSATASNKRDPAWTESIAVGSKDFLESIRNELGQRAFYRRIRGADGALYLRDGHIA